MSLLWEYRTGGQTFISQIIIGDEKWSTATRRRLREHVNSDWSKERSRQIISNHVSPSLGLLRCLSDCERIPTSHVVHNKHAGIS